MEKERITEIEQQAVKPVFEKMSANKRESLNVAEQLIGAPKVTRKLVRNVKKLVKALSPHLGAAKFDSYDEVHRVIVENEETGTFFGIVDRGIVNLPQNPIRPGIKITQLTKDQKGNYEAIGIPISVPKKPKNVTRESINHLFDITPKSFREAAKILESAEPLN
ncbi:MAG: hypothetical protein WEC80_02580 [Patescibacteria group bacterium]